ncbi:hypothetical protein N7490_005206 [Penicillium lividum]|nr:hypothetical protein N7490_005206 [Penicillium lividum]
MSANPKRATVLPNSLWRGVDEDTADRQITPPARVLDKRHTFRLGVPIIPSESRQDLSTPEGGSLMNYHRSYKIDQAGPGVIALKDCQNLPSCLIKECETRRSRYIRNLKAVTHKNLISLLDFFESGQVVYLVYEYEHMAISLGCVAGTVQFNEADVATICKEILEGLTYIHSELKTLYGLLNLSNIVLTWQGQVKLANIGECLLAKESSTTAVQKDIKEVGLIVVKLSDRAASISDSVQDGNLQFLSRLARSFLHRTKTEPYIEPLMKVERGV